MAQVMTVVSVQGAAFIVGTDGAMRAAKPGAKLALGETLVTAANARVELAAEDGAVLPVGPQTQLKVDEQLFATAAPVPQQAALASGTIERVIDTLAGTGQLDEELEAPAAGAGAGGADDGSGFVRLLRVVEGVDPLAFNFETNLPELPPDFPALNAQIEEVPVPLPPAPAPQPPAPAPQPPAPAPQPPAPAPQPPAPAPQPPAPAPQPPAPAPEPPSPPPPSPSPPPAPLPQPVVSEAVVSESGLSNGSAPGSGAHVVTGVITGLPPGWSPVPTTGSTPWGTYTINADGTYTYTLNNATTDVPGAPEVDVITYPMTLSPGVVVNNTLNVTVLDDVPQVALQPLASGPTLEVDETELQFARSSSASFADAFTATVTPGADGLGSLSSVYALTVPADDTPSGLMDVATGSPVLLRALPDGSVQGVVQGTDDVAFTVAVDAAGQVTLTLLRALNHPDAINPNDALSLDAGLITLSRTDTVADGDGDTATATAALDLGSRLSFLDDGPRLNMGNVPPAIEEPLLLDDTRLGVPVVVNLPFAAPTSPVYGFDGPGSFTGQVFSLSLSQADAVTNLVDTATGEPVQLRMNGAVVEGFVSGVAQPVFTIAVDASTGQVTVTQYRSLAHPDGSNPNDAVFLQGSEPLVALSARSTVVDKDGDSVTDEQRMWLDPLMEFRDDGPTAQNDGTQTVQEDGTVQAVSGNVLANDAFGADGPHASNAVAWADNTAAVQALSNYGTLTLGADGSYTFVLANNSPAVQALTSQQVIEQTLSYTIRDGDGDTSTASVTIRIQGQDDTLGLSAPRVSVDERGLVSAADTSEVAQGSITLQSSSPLQTVQIGGTTFTLAQLQDLASLSPAQRSIVTSKGTLTLTGFEPDASDGGSLQYSYTLSNAQNHTAGASVFDDFVVRLQTAAGSEQTTLRVDIVDDVPRARDDADQVTAGGAGLLSRSTNGNVIDGVGTTSASTGVDAAGADGALRVVSSNGQPVVGPTQIVGTYGTLTLSANGFYTYTVTNPAAVDGMSDVFNYIVADADGSTASATLTVFLGRDALVPQVTGDRDQVSEAGLPAGSGAGSNVHIATGQFVVKDNGQGFALTVAGVPVVLSSGLPQTINGGLGTLEITGYTVTGSGASSQYVIDYRYTLTQATANNTTPGQDAFAVSVIDGTGDASNVGQIVIDVMDDKPVARPDTDSVPADHGLVARGNVITGDGTAGGLNGAGADSFSADGARVTSVLREGTSTSVAAGSSVNGQYGRLTLNADGSYTYSITSNHNGAAVGFSEVFRYTVTDGDGSTSTATLTIQIGPSNLVPRVTVSDGQVWESDINPRGAGASLVAGSTPAGDREFFQGEFRVDMTGENGWRSVTLNGLNVAVGTVIDTPHGRLTITQWPTSGEIRIGKYTYELRNPADHSTGPLSDRFTLRAVDFSGDADEKTFDIRIVDDAPRSNVDTDQTLGYPHLISSGSVISGAGTQNPAGGRDQAGADGGLRVVDVSTAFGAGSSATVTNGVATLQGQYGTLTLLANGQYAYEVRQLVSGTGPINDTFTYTVRDRDGSTSTSQVVINIDPINGSGGGSSPLILFNPVAVDEEGLSPSGSSAGNGTQTVSSNFILLGFGAGTPTLQIAGQPVDLGNLGSGVTVPTANGTMTITGWDPTTGVVRYTYTLTSPLDHTVSALANVPIEAASAGNPAVSQSANLPVTVLDDVPVARGDVDSVRVGAANPATGNLITGVDAAGGDSNTTDGVGDAPGADGALRLTQVNGAAVAATGDTVIAGLYGTLTITADGRYSYQPSAANNANKQDVFTYTVADRDGSSSTARLTVNLLPNDTVPVVTVTPGPNGTAFQESHLPIGSNPSGVGEKLTGFTVTIQTGGVPLASVNNPYVGTHTMAQISGASSSNPISFANGNYRVTYTSYSVSGDTVTFTYDVERLSRVTNVNDADLASTVTWLATNTLGASSANTAPSRVTHQFVDDRHVAVDDTIAAAEGAGLPVTGSLITNDIRGADGAITVVGAAVGAASGAPITGGVGLVLNGAYGTLVVAANGTYTYTGVAQSVPPGATDTFSYTIADSDGSRTSATVTVNLTQDTRVPLVTIAAFGPVHEAGLSLADVLSGDFIGSSAGDAATPTRTSGSFAIQGNGEVVTLRIDGVPVALSAASVGSTYSGDHGVLSITGITTNSAGEMVVAFDYQLKDNRVGAGGDSFSLSVTDATGDTVVRPLVIGIVDDAPVARHDTDSGPGTAGALVQGNLMTGEGTNQGVGGAGADSSGADGALVAGLVAGTGAPGAAPAGSYTVAGAFGQLTVWPDGSYRYEVAAAGASGGTDVFTYLLLDADGSTSTAMLTIDLASTSGRALGALLPESDALSPLDVLAPASEPVLDVPTDAAPPTGSAPQGIDPALSLNLDWSDPVADLLKPGSAGPADG